MQETVERILYRLRSKGFLILALVIFSACASPPPFEEYTVARAAIGSAKEFDSAKYATSLWNKADELYQLAQKQFQNRDYDEARRNFRMSKEYAERAENLTRLKKSQSGDMQ